MKESFLETLRQEKLRREKEVCQNTARWWLSQVFPGRRVIEKTSGHTGEIYQIFPFGVQVWNMDTGYNRENWVWSMMTLRHPRLVKRYPRPFRWPREKLTEVCHCKVGRMEVEGHGKVRCTRCKYLVGSESYPNRLERASGFLRKAYPEASRPKTQTSKSLLPPGTRKSPRDRKLRQRKKRQRLPSRLVISRRPRKEDHYASSRKSKAQVPSHSKISTLHHQKVSKAR